MTVTHGLLFAAVCFVVGANVGVLFLGAIKRRIQRQEPHMTRITTEEIEALAERLAAARAARADRLRTAGPAAWQGRPGPGPVGGQEVLLGGVPAYYRH
jgi:hypothetical protein